MYKVTKTSPFFFRHFFCNSRRGYNYYNQPTTAAFTHLGEKPTTTSINETPFNINQSSSDCNKPFYFKSEDYNLKKIEKINECFKHFYYNRNGSQYIDTFESMFQSWENEFAKYRGFRTPRTTITENDKGITINLELPGFSKENLKIEFINNSLHVEAKTLNNINTNNNNNNNNQAQTETNSTQLYEFKKSIKLPNDIDTNLVKAVMNNGNLEVTIPRNSYVRSKQINVQ